MVRTEYDDATFQCHFKNLFVKQYYSLKFVSYSRIWLLEQIVLHKILIIEALGRAMNPGQ